MRYGQNKNVESDIIRFIKAAPREVWIIYLSRKSGGDCPSVAS
jgi:hypothetical protein